METFEQPKGFQKKDTYFGFAAGFFIGLLFLPVLQAAKPELFFQIAWFVIPFFFIATPLGLAIAKRLSVAVQKLAVIWQIAKFGVIGVLNTFVDLGILSFLSFWLTRETGLDAKTMAVWSLTFYSLFKAFSFIVANINSFYWNKYWTFEANPEKKSSTEFTQFFFVSLVGFLLNVFVASFVFKSVPAILGLNVQQWGLIGALAGTAVGLVWNFLGYKLWVFKK